MHGSFGEYAQRVLLFFGVAVAFVSTLGILFMRGTYDKLHYLAPLSTLGTVAVAAAVIIREGWSPTTAKTVLIVLLMLVSGPILGHATARAQETREELSRRRGEGE